MAKKTNTERVVLPDPLNRDKDWTIHPEFNAESVLWVFLYGLPAFALFMILTKANPL